MEFNELDINETIINDEIKDDIKLFVKEVFPENKIPIFLSPVSNTDSLNFTTWNMYSSTGPYNQFNDNFCRPNEVGEYQYPKITDLESCGPMFNDNVMDLTDMNNFISNMEINLEDDLEIDIDELKNKIEENMEKYKNQKIEYLDQEKIKNNLKHIGVVINQLNKDNDAHEAKMINQINVNEDTIEPVNYNYLAKHYYIYTIIGLVFILTILAIVQFTY